MTFKKLTTFSLFVCISAQSFGQQKTLIDSTFQYLSDKYDQLRLKDSILARNYINFYILKANKEKDTVHQINGYQWLSHSTKKDSIYIDFLDHLVLQTKNKVSKLFPAYAYLRKGRFLYANRKFAGALIEYLKVIEITNKIKNDKIRYIAFHRIASLKSKAKEYNISNKLYLEIYKYHYEKKYTLLEDKANYYSVLIDISTNFQRQEKYDSAYFYIDLAKKYVVNSKLNDYIGYTFYKQGTVEFELKEFNKALISLNQSTHNLISDENYSILLSTYGYIAKSHYHLNNKKSTLNYSFLIDSLSNEKKIIHFTQRFALTRIIDFYKKKGNLKGQLKYVNKLMHIDSILNSRGRKLDKTFYEEYDKPKLLAEREEIIKKLKSKSNTTIYSLLGVSGIVLFLFGFQYRKRKQLKLRFEKIVKNKGKLETGNKTQEPKEDLSIPKEVIEKVLEGLEGFEKNTAFTSSVSLASYLETNANYLSKIINRYKGSGFSTYINSLRVNHVIHLLDTDSRIRKYSIKGIAEEMGYKNAESFSKAFYKKTGLKPSYYIKELGKLEV